MLPLRKDGELIALDESIHLIQVDLKMFGILYPVIFNQLKIILIGKNNMTFFLKIRGCYFLYGTLTFGPPSQERKVLLHQGRYFIITAFGIGYGGP